MLSAQVRIKERVEIDPVPKNVLSLDTKSFSPRNIHVEFSASTGVPLRLGAYGGCPGEEKWVVGNNPVSLDFIYTGQTTIDYQIHITALYDENLSQVPYHLKITDDTRLLNDFDGIMDMSGWTWSYSTVYLFGIYADLKYNLYSPEICAGSPGLISFEPEYYQECSTTYIPETEPVTLSIIRGQQFGGLSLDHVNIINGSVTFLVDKRKDVIFIPVDSMPEGIIVDTVEIKIQAGVMTETKTIAVRACSRGTSFNFTAEKPEIYIRTQDALSVQPAMDENSTIVWDKKTDPVTFTITSGSEYGGFAVNGENQGGTSVTLQGTQLDQLSFIACDSLPNGLTEGPVSIQASSKGIVKNASLIVQSTSKLKLTLDISPTSIEYGGYTTAEAQTVNIETEEPEAPPGDVTYNFTLTQGSEFARFYEYDGTGGASASVVSLSKTSSTNENNSINTHKLKRSRILTKSVLKGLNKSNKDEVKYSIKSSLSATALDNGGPDALNNVAQSDGNAYVWPEATDQEPVNPEGETVQVVVSASDANIASASGEFLVKSSCIVVSVYPDTIKQGESATITVQKKNASGELEDLSADDYVEFEITGGANAGTLSSPDGSQTGGYIGGTFQSATFTAALDPSLPDDNPVRISVYTDYCSGLGKLTVTKDACADAPQCEGSSAPIQVILKELKRGDVTPDLCLQRDKNGNLPGGIFKPRGVGAVEPYDIQACFDRNVDKWRFSIPNIKINVFLDICKCNLLNYKIIENVSMLSSNEACDALIDYVSADYYSYPITLPDGASILAPILLAHEQQHKKDYESILKSGLPELENGLKKIQFKCEEAISLNDAIQKAKVFTGDVISDFISKAIDENNKTSNDPNNEQKTQLNIINEIIAVRNQLVNKCASGGKI